jgi:hypothetical protein
MSDQILHPYKTTGKIIALIFYDALPRFPKA